MVEIVKWTGVVESSKVPEQGKSFCEVKRTQTTRPKVSLRTVRDEVIDNEIRTKQTSIEIDNLGIRVNSYKTEDPDMFKVAPAKREEKPILTSRWLGRYFFEVKRR
jgi:hypothetical protein